MTALSRLLAWLWLHLTDIFPAELPSLDGITAELAEHSGTLDHALAQTEDGHWYCCTCGEHPVGHR